jgi:hypothetical protein
MNTANIMVDKFILSNDTIIIEPIFSRYRDCKYTKCRVYNSSKASVVKNDNLCELTGLFSDLLELEQDQFGYDSDHNNYIKLDPEELADKIRAKSENPESIRFLFISTTHFSRTPIYKRLREERLKNETTN